MTLQDGDDLLAAFLNEGVPEQTLTSDRQRRLTDEFAALYKRRGLMNGGQAPPLRECCPDAPTCWKKARQPDSSPGASLPWIGPDYPERDGVVVITMNMNGYGGLAAEFALASGKDGELQGFARGSRRVSYGHERRTYSGSDRAYRTTRSAASVLDKLEGREIADHERPQQLVGPLQRIARWNAIKCSPYKRPHSKPYAAMWSHCPEMLLVDEFRIAKPKVVLTFGPEVFEAVKRMPGFAEDYQSDQWLKRGALVIDGRRIEILGLYHPAARSRRAGQKVPWQQSHDALLSLLRSDDCFGG